MGLRLALGGGGVVVIVANSKCRVLGCIGYFDCDLIVLKGLLGNFGRIRRVVEKYSGVLEVAKRVE